MESIGRVLFGINNIYTVEKGGRLIECRIKGKVLSGAEAEYNPLAPGDLVEVKGGDGGQALIVGRLKRKSALRRWNKKGRAVQTLAANLDVVLCVSSPDLPPFRPRFVDRVAAQAEFAGTGFLLCLNKADLGVPPEVEERLVDYTRMGYPVLKTSCVTGEGIETLSRTIEGRLVALVGQSGVGKSTLLNRLTGGNSLRTGPVSAKYNRGRHTTVVARLLPDGRGQGIVDTPGVREFDLYGIPAAELHHYYRDFARFRSLCRMQGCTHIHEPGCAVIEAVERGDIHADRFEGYVRVCAELEEARRTAYE